MIIGRKNINYHPTKKLLASTSFKIRFNEVDPLGIAWHGHYLQYFENGREAFGEQYQLSYMDIFNKGFVVPIVSIHCDYKKSLRYGDKAIVKTTFIDNPAAKIHFQYSIFLEGSEEILAEGYSVQVFLDKENRTLQLTSPDFFTDWKEKYLKG